MSPVLTLLNEMRGRLGMYLGTSSLAKLAAFLRGYDYARERLGREHPDCFLANFRDWVHNHFHDASRSWEDTILKHSANDDDAVKRFWELLDAYCDEQGLMAGASRTEHGNCASSSGPTSTEPTQGPRSTAKTPRRG